MLRHGSPFVPSPMCRCEQGLLVLLVGAVAVAVMCGWRVIAARGCGLRRDAKQ